VLLLVFIVGVFVAVADFPTRYRHNATVLHTAVVVVVVVVRLVPLPSKALKAEVQLTARSAL
jgi:hypothetical protein